MNHSYIHAYHLTYIFHVIIRPKLNPPTMFEKQVNVNQMCTIWQFTMLRKQNCTHAESSPAELYRMVKVQLNDLNFLRPLLPVLARCLGPPSMYWLAIPSGQIMHLEACVHP